jgi:integrase/recombinase XerC/integrase/recombinase XerD
MELVINHGTGTPKFLSDRSAEGIIQTFLDYQDVRPSTKHTYTKALKQFFRWVMETGRTFAELKLSDIIQFKQDLIESKVSGNTINLYLTGVRKLYEFLEAMGICSNIAKTVKSPKLSRRHEKQALTIQQVRDLLSYCEENLTSRDFAIINLIVRTGLRTIEVSRALLGDVKMKGGRRVLYIQGKGQDEKKEFVILSKKVWEPIKKYLKEERLYHDDHEPLFVTYGLNSSFEAISTRTLSRICKEALRGIGLDNKVYTAHSLRHTAACSMLKAGVGLEDVREVLRHSSTETTRIYLKTIEEEMRLQRASELALDHVF